MTGSTSEKRIRPAARLFTPAGLAVAGGLLAVLAFQLWLPAGNPPGFIDDEVSFAYSAWSIAHHLRDQFGGFLPLYFKSYGDYKSPIFVYVLAAVFRVTAPTIGVARFLGTVGMLGALVVLAVIAFRRSRPGVAVAAIMLAGLCPWLYALGRFAYDSTFYPLAVGGVLLATDVALRSARALALRAAYVAFALGFLTYCYAGGRLLGPFFAVALVVFWSRERLRLLVEIWIGYALLLVPLGIYALRHPHALTARYNTATFIHPGMSLLSIVRQAALNYVQDVDLWHWITGGDPRPYFEIPGYGNLLAALALVGLLGVVEVVWHRRSDRWWLFVVVSLVLSPIPASLTFGRYNDARLSPLPYLLAVLALPGLELIAGSRLRLRVRVAVLTLLAGLGVAQWVHFVDVYSRYGGVDRRELYEADVPPLLKRAFAAGSTVYVDHNDLFAQTHALWYAVSHGLAESRVSILPNGGVPATGALVFGRFVPCNFVCTQLAGADRYWIARTVGPRATPPTLTFGAGFNAPEQYYGQTRSWMIQNGRVEVVNRSGPLLITISALAFSNRQSRMLAIETRTGRVLARTAVPTNDGRISLGPFRMPAGTFTLTLVATPGPARLGPTDPRKASIYLSAFTATATSAGPGG
jgi:hypothetical protein